MAQKNWQLNNVWGRNHIIGLYHGHDSGHVVVHCDNKVLLLDFNVLGAKTYSFFIDQELYELSILSQAGAYEYELKINYQADTPQNNSRKTEKKEERQAILLSLLIVALLLLSAFLFVHFYVDLESLKN